MRNDEDWTEDAGEYWSFVVDCLVTFHGLDEAKAVASCSELRALLEEPIPGVREEDDFKWLYMHEEPCYMADSVSQRNGGHEVFLTDDNLKRYTEFRDAWYH